jgi:ABC-type nitrate/sulfonate/bicarbonate transport system ATPase subunit
MNNSPYLAINDLCIGYEQKVVAFIDSLAVTTAEVVALIGPSGCGKSTLLATISGAMPSISGAIQIMGAPRTVEWRMQNVSRTLQNFPLLHWLTVKENLTLAAKIRGVAIQDVEGLLGLFQASHLAGKFPKTLSGGERCRASLAQALVSPPALLLLDEPFSGLDVAVKEQVANAVFNLVKERGIPVLYVTHDLLDACAFSNRIVILNKGTPTKVGGVFKANEPSIQERLFVMMAGRHNEF